MYFNVEPKMKILNLTFKKGDSFDGGSNISEANIHVNNWFGRIVVYGESLEDSEKLRDYVLDCIAENANLRRVNKELIGLFDPIDNAVRPLCKLGESVHTKALELITSSCAGKDNTAPEIFGYVLQDRDDFVFYKNKPTNDVELSENEIISHKVYLEQTAENKQQRITEQDAREIVSSWLGYEIRRMGTEVFEQEFLHWIDQKGRALLAKLNEHRELDYKAQLEELLAYIKAVVEIESWYAVESQKDPAPDFGVMKKVRYCWQKLHTAIDKASTYVAEKK
jgi:hypothetical protein